MADDKCEFPAPGKRKRIDLRQYLNENEEVQDYYTIHNLPLRGPEHFPFFTWWWTL